MMIMGEGRKEGLGCGVMWWWVVVLLLLLYI